MKAVIEISLGIEPKICLNNNMMPSAIKFIFNQNDIKIFDDVKKNKNINIVKYDIDYEKISEVITDSSNRHGYFIMTSKDLSLLDDVLNIG